MVKVLLEKETIYADEVDMIMKGATAEEVIKVIDDKAKTKEEAKKQNKKNTTVKTNYVDFLINEAEKRAELLKEKNKENTENVVSEEKSEEQKSSEEKVEQTTKTSKSTKSKDQDKGNK